MSMDAIKDSRTKESGRIDNQAMHVLMPDIYADEPVSQKIDIEIVDKSKSDADESSGYDPYDTVTLHKK